MANIFSLLSNGYVIEKKEIVEGLNPPIEFKQRLKDFFPEEVYNINTDSLLYKFLYSILGDAGANGVKKAFLAPKLAEALSSTSFTDLDSLFSNVFQLNRLNDEIYKYDPYNQLLTQEQWAEIRRKDAWYKARSQDYMRGIHLGSTADGFKLLGRASTGYECNVFEQWKFLDDIHSDAAIGIPNYGKTNSSHEIVIQPQVDNLSVEEDRRINRVFNRLKPANVLVTVNTTSDGLIEVPIVSGTASSHNFLVQRYVTGNTLLDYSDTSRNNWIEAGVKKEAPLSAFGDHTESVTYLTINSISASSFHLGNFSTTQQNLFAHLKRPDNTYPYSADKAISDNPDIYKMQSPWLPRSAGKDSFVVNDHYPVGYFADEKFNLDKPSKLFWASQEAEPDLAESLTVDLGSVRPVNMVEFEISQKPINITIFYLDENTQEWELVTYRSDVNSEDAIYYGGGNSYTWEHISLYFENIQTRKIKIEFERRTDPYPNLNSPPFPWSIEVRNLKLAFVVANIDDFNVNKGVDIVGNAYETSLLEHDSSKAWDKQENTYWQSQINPSRFAVESLYFDVSTNNNPNFIDEIYLDPLTPQCLMHIYYSNDDDYANDWDNKLWTPIPRHFLISRGNVKLYQSIFAKYIKLEFTKLTPTPYNTLGLSIELNTTYRMYPSWVESYVFSTIKTAPNNPLQDPVVFKTVEADAVNMGLINPPTDKLKDEVPRNIINFIKENKKSTVLSEYQVWKNPETNKDNTLKLEKTIDIYPNYNANLYQQKILDTIKIENINRAFRKLKTTQDRDTWIPENPVVPKDLIEVATTSNRSKIVEEKNWPDMWFMRKCRHGYKIVQAPRSANIGYYVAIREIRFYKKDKTVREDSPSYSESLLDETTTLTNTFYQKDWKWGLPPEREITLGSNDIIEYGSESFNGVAF